MKEWHESSAVSQIMSKPGELQPCCIMKGGAALEGTWQKWAVTILMSFNKGKCEVLRLGQNNPTYLLDSKLNVSQQHVLEVKKASCILGGISKYVGRVLRKLFFSPTCSTSRTTSGVLYPVLASPVKKKDKKNIVEWVWLRVTKMMMGRGPWVCSD